MGYGQKSNIGINFQNSFSTGAQLTNSMYFIPHLTEGVGLDIPDMPSENMHGIFDEGDSYDGPRLVGGDIETEIQAIPFGVFAKAMFGDPTTVTSTGVYTHTFKPRIADFDSYSAGNPLTYHQYLDVGSAQLLYNLNATVLELTAANGEFLKAKLSLVGGSYIQNANVAASYGTGKHFTWDVNSVSIGGTAVDDYMNFTITVDEALEATHTMNGSKYPSRIKRSGMRTVKVGATLRFRSQDEYQDFLARTEQELIINFKGITEIQSGYFEEIKIQLPKMRYTENKPVAGGPGEIEASVSASGKYDASSATAFQLTIVNTQAAY